MLKEILLSATTNTIMNEHRQLVQHTEKIGSTGEALVFAFAGFLCVIGILAAGIRIRKRRRQQRQIALARQRARSSSMSRNDYPMAQRKTHIEAYLVTKPALSHDALCDHARGETVVEGSTTQTSSCPHFSRKQTKDPTVAAVIDNVRREGSNCPEEVDGCTICLENFEPSDLVSWSPNPACCKRVFHHACFKEWLLKNKHCPWCRETVLPVDGYSAVKTTKKQIQDLLIAQQQRSVPSFYCCSHGTVQPSKFAQRGQRLSDLLAERSMYICSRAEILEKTLQTADEEEGASHSLTLDEQTTADILGRGNDGEAEIHDINRDRDLELGLTNEDESFNKHRRETEQVYDTGDESSSSSSGVEATN